MCALRAHAIGGPAREASHRSKPAALLYETQQSSRQSGAEAPIPRTSGSDLSPRTRTRTRTRTGPTRSSRSSRPKDRASPPAQKERHRAPDLHGWGRAVLKGGGAYSRRDPPGEEEPGPVPRGGEAEGWRTYLAGCVCVIVCVGVCVGECVCPCMRASYLCACVCVCVCVHTSVCARPSVRVCVRACIHVSVCAR